jgi:hypothetical protein
MQDVNAGQKRIRGLSAIEYPTGHGIQAVEVADLVTSEQSHSALVREALADALAALASGQIIGLVDRVECERTEHQAAAHDAYLRRIRNREALAAVAGATRTGKAVPVPVARLVDALTAEVAA